MPFVHLSGVSLKAVQHAKQRSCCSCKVSDARAWALLRGSCTDKQKFAMPRCLAYPT